MNYFWEIIICLILSAFFSGMEIAFLSANRLRIEIDKLHGLSFSKIISFFLKNPTHYIVTILIGNNLVLVIYGIMMSNLLKDPLSVYINNEFYLMTIQTIISTIFILFSAEFIPKLVFRIIPNFFLNYFIIFIYLFYVLFYPLTIVLIKTSHNIISKFTGKNQNQVNEKYIFQKVDIEQFIEESQPQKFDDIDTEHEIRIFQKALNFPNIKLRDCMVPRTELCAIDISSKIDELKQKFIETGFSKILVYEKNIDNIIGYISIKELFKHPKNIKNKIISAPIGPETMPAKKMLQTLLKEHKSLAIVVDEFGVTSGIVTIEDIMEEIFGEIEDEHDINETVEKVLSDNSFIFSGKLEINFLNEKYELNLPESQEYDTLAGYVLFKIGRVPNANESFDIDDYSFKILKTINKKLELIYLKKKDKE